jgi:predicted nucleic acid-binding protein
MILIDTSVWISYFRGEARSAFVEKHIISGGAVIHPYIIGELLLGGLSSRTEKLLGSLSIIPEIEPGMVYEFIKKHGLHNSGIGWVDVILIASSLISGCTIYTFDDNLRSVSARLGCLYKE